MAINGITSKKEHVITIKDEDIKPEYRAQARSPRQEKDNSYEKFNIWANNIHIKAHEKAAESALQYTDPQLGDELCDKNYKEIYNHTYAENAFTEENVFDLAQGKTLNTREELLAVYDDIAPNHVLTYDTDGDQKISIDELTAKEVENYNTLYADEGEALSAVDPEVQQLFTTTHNFFDINGDGYIDTEETKCHYIIMDALDDKGMDGKITFNSYRTMDLNSGEDPEVNQNTYYLKSNMMQAYKKYYHPEA